MLVRFAPSPTGRLHVGNARTAAINWLYARKHGGKTLLRMDDTDDTRSTAAFEQGIRDDLAWLGLDWDLGDRQSARMQRYEDAKTALVDAGRLYPCYETAEELALKRKAALQAGRPPIYDRAALDLTDAQRRAYEAEGRVAHWRFKLDPGTIGWSDLVRGAVKFEAEDLSDPVVIREDGRYLYMLPSSVDDIDHAITHVLRGEDHVANTAIQIQMIEALGGSVPAFGHLPLITGEGGEALSKRLGSLSLADLRDEGVEPTAVVAVLAALGTPHAPVEAIDIAPIVEAFDLADYGRATPKFQRADLDRVSTQVVHRLPFDRVADRLTALGISGAAAGPFWDAVRGNLETVSQAADLWAVVGGAVTLAEPLSDEDKAFLATAEDLLPAAPWDGDTWAMWTGALKEATGRKGKGLFMPLRLALTGQARGPELAPLLPLIGPVRVAERLTAAR